MTITTNSIAEPLLCPSRIMAWRNAKYVYLRQFLTPEHIHESLESNPFLIGDVHYTWLLWGEVIQLYVREMNNLAKNLYY